MARSNLVDVEGHLEHETPLAYLFWSSSTSVKVWLPKSACQWDPDDKTMTLPEPLAIDKGLV